MLPHKRLTSVWQSCMAERLQTELYFAQCHTPIASAALSPRERAQLGAFSVTERRLHWRRGRAALKQVLAHMRMPSETSDLVFPHPRLSLSHSADYALAVGTADELSGLGVDLEFGRGPRREAAHLFMDENELATWLQLPRTRQAAYLLRLWCIKEAAFKANPHNRTTVLSDYTLEDIHATTGRIINSADAAVGIDYSLTHQRIGQHQACIAVAIARNRREITC